MKHVNSSFVATFSAMVFQVTHSLLRPGVGKVRPTGQIQPASSVHLARGDSSVLTLNSARKTYRTTSDCFHAERDLVAH